MSGNGNQVPLAPCQRGPGTYPRASTPHRSECYHPTGTATTSFLPVTQPNLGPPPNLRAQPTPQPSAPPAPQQDMSKTTMAGLNFVSQQSQSQQARPQYPNFSYRAQHGTRPNTHPRQQQPYLGNTAGGATGPVVYHHPTLLFQPHMGLPQTYQQPRSSSSGFYPYMAPYLGYSTPASHTPPFYYSNNQQLASGGVASGATRGNTPLVGPQPAAPTVPVTIAHPQPPPHLQPTMPGVRSGPTKRSHRVPIIDPDTHQEVLPEVCNNVTYFMGNETSERQTPQPEPPSHSIAEEFSRLVNESIANQVSLNDTSIKLGFGARSVDITAPTVAINMQPQLNAISSINNNIAKSDILNINENKNLGPDVVAQTNETPVVSAISDSPVIVPKMPTNIKQFQKTSEPTQCLAIDTNKNVPMYKQPKQKNKPIVPQDDILEKPIENASAPLVAITPAVPMAAEKAAPVESPAAPSAASHLFAPFPVPYVQPAPVAASSPPTALPQRIREPRERVRSEEKDKPNDNIFQEKDLFMKLNGPTSIVSSVDSIPEIINPATSQINQAFTVETKTPIVNKPPLTELLVNTPLTKIEILNNNDPPTSSDTSAPSATELLSASIEKVAKESTAIPDTYSDGKEASSAIQAQAKLTQSITSCTRVDPDSKMKDFNLNFKTTDPDNANGNAPEVKQIKDETVKEDINKNEKVMKNPKSNKKSGNKVTNNEASAKETNLHENGKDETDKVSNEQEEILSKTDELMEKAPAIIKVEPASPIPAIFVPKYKYSDDQWSPMNKSGKKCYDISLLKQMKDDPLSKSKPNAPLLEVCNVIRSMPHQEPQPFSPITRPVNDSLFPNFAKSTGVSSRGNTPREPKKDGRNMANSGKGSMKLSPSPSGNSSHKAVIRLSLTREEVKLNQTKDAWKPTRLKNANLSEEDFKTQELYKKFRGILNKLTPQKFDTLMEKVKTLEINNQSRLQGIIDLVFQKAIDEPNFSEAYANMCNKLTTIKVPADNAPSDQYVNFRALIISKCQNQFVTEKVDENILKLEKEVYECTDPVKKKELQSLLEEENRKVRMKSVGNVRFIGELYKLKMLTSKIMVYCMNYLVDKLEEEKLECLCKLLTTIGEQVESEVKEQLEVVFKRMQEIVEKKSNKISSRVRFMIKDVIELRQRRWVVKSVVDSQPKMMDQIQKEADQQQRHIELMNAAPMGGYGRREDGGRGKRGGEGRRQGNNYMDNNWKASPRTNYTVDMSKLKAVTQKNLSNVKLAPQHTTWNYGSGMKNTVQASSNSMISLTKNKYSMLENSPVDPTLLRASPDLAPSYAKGASIERSTFNTKEFNTGSKSGSTSEAPPRTTPSSQAAVEPPPPVVLPAEPLPEAKKKSVKSMIELSLINPDNDEVVADVRQLFPLQYHAAVVTEIVNIALEKSPKEIDTVAKTVVHLVTTNTISADNVLAGLAEIFEFAPDLYIDIPMLYAYLAKFVTPLIEKKLITFPQTFRLCEKTVVSANHGQLFLKAVINDLKESMGPSFVKSKWQESGLELKQWMNEDHVPKWIEDNKYEFLEGVKVCEETKKILTPAEVQSKLLQLMNSDETCECVRGWIQDNVGESCSDEWFTRALMQAVCSHALLGGDGAWHLSRERMHKYARLLHELAARCELSCLLAVQRLVHKLEHPQGLTLDIFQYLHEQYIISVEGFIAWETTEKEPEGKAVMLKALTSFFTNIREADNEDSCSED
ncbi:eukaryotic translation initiation factor 4 gamma 3-like isoform X2 [Battus philenor]|uniref:eukaryotic translation initiation factor 4 gamma 3-like isoform X2 n=1 Tax=Battus philenor TaxID=42288 RepID=UPI0035CEA539